MIITKLMTNWKSFLKKDIINWLLEKENPSVRYYTLTKLLEKKSQDSEVKEAKEQIMKTGVIPKILSKQNPKGYWGVPEDFYIRSKYKGTVWIKELKTHVNLFSIILKIQKVVVFLMKDLLQVEELLVRFYLV